MSKGKTLSDSLYIPSLDSFKIRFPLDSIEIIDSRLYEHQTKYTIATDTGEIYSEESIQNNSLKVPFSNYHIHFRIEQIFENSYLAILINSKLLEYQYREGIHSGNIQSIYERINGCNVIALSYNDFMQGQVTDIDIKKDVVLSSDLFKKAIPQFNKKTIPRKNQGQGVLSFNKKNNLGIQWNDRKHSSPTAPFLKFYHKGIEAICSKNRSFFAQYVDVTELSDVVRIETTIKNLKHLRTLKIHSNRLQDILELSHEKLDSIIRHSVTSNLHERIKIVKPRDTSKLSPSDSVLFALISYLIETNEMSIEQAIELGLNNIEGKQERYRQKQRLQRIYSEQIEGEKYAIQNKQITSFFDTIGW